MSENRMQASNCPPERTSCTGLKIVETKIDYIEDAIKRSAEKLENIDIKVDSISNHIATHNGAIPGIQANISTLVSQLRENDKLTQSTAVKSKIAWAVFSSIATGLVLMLARMLFGG